jgi:uncharacterized protein (TIGR01777 family)
MQTVLITGGSGLVGQELSKMLINKGFKVIILSRNKNSSNNNIQYAQWDIKKQTIDLKALQEADFIIHLAGAGVVDKKWTESYKKEILLSRTESSKLIIDALSKNPNKVKAIISASAIGWYGPDKKNDYSFSETDAPDNNFLGETCRLWEESVDPATKIGIRVCKLRTGIVLTKKGGALREFIKPIKMGIAGILGRGNQIISWIHIEDLCRMFIHCMENDQLQGSYNAVAPSPVSNKTLTISLAKLLKGIFFIPVHVPVFILKLMMGQRSIEILKSTTVSCEKIKKTGFVFYYPTIDAALKNIFLK